MQRSSRDGLADWQETWEEHDRESRKSRLVFRRPLDEPGLSIEGGVHYDWSVRDLCLPLLFIGVNVGRAPTHLDRRDGLRRATVVTPPGGIWFNPADVPIDVDTRREPRGHSPKPHRFLTLLLDPSVVTRLTGHEKLRFSLGLGVEDKALSHLIQSLGEEARLGSPNGRSFERSLLTTIAGYLARRFAAEPMRVGKERLTAAQLRRATQFIEDRLDVGASIDDIASALGLSPFYFARAFRNATGKGPHGFLIERRLQRVHEDLATGRLSVAEAAAWYGFADQSHLGRLFKRRYGVPPGVMRNRKGAPPSK